MGYGVVNVKNVELVVTTHFRHLYRERQCIIGILEQSVIINHHRVKKKSRSIERHAKRTLVADEMNLMSAAGQFFAERGSQNAASPNGRVTGDSDLQSISWIHIKIFALRCPLAQAIETAVVRLEKEPSHD